MDQHHWGLHFVDVQDWTSRAIKIRLNPWWSTQLKRSFLHLQSAQEYSFLGSAGVAISKLAIKRAVQAHEIRKAGTRNRRAKSRRLRDQAERCKATITLTNQEIGR